MPEINWPTFLSLLGLLAAAGLIVRVFPHVLGASFLRGVDSYYAKALEKLKADLSRDAAKDIEQKKDELARTTARELDSLRADYTALRASADYLSANQAELRSRMIAACNTLWGQMLKLRHDFGGMINVETILVPTELAEMFEQGKYKTFRDSYLASSDHLHVLQTASAAVTVEVEACRLFASVRLWQIFYVFRALITRVAYMGSMGLEKRQYRDWRKDEPTLRLLSLVLPDSTIKGILDSSLPALENVLGQLEAHFLREAMRLMTGSTVLADSISDVQATMAYETERVRQAQMQRASANVSGQDR